MDRDNMLAQWQKGLRIFHIAHNTSATQYGRRHMQLGSAVVVLSTAVGTTVFSTLEDTSPSLWIKITAGVLSISAAVLSALQTFLRYSELAEQHKETAIRFGQLRRELELRIHQGEPDPEFLNDFRKRWDEVEKSAPQIPRKRYAEAAEKVGNSLREKVEPAEVELLPRDTPVDPVSR